MWLLVYLLLIVVPVYAIYRIRRYNSYLKHIDAIPGPQRYPFVGCVGELLKSNPDDVFENDRKRNIKYPDIHSLWVFHVSFVAFNNAEDTEAILSNTKHNSKSDTYSMLHAWLATGLLTSSGDKWQSRRKILTPAFHFSILQEFIDIFNRETKHLVRVLEEKCHEDYIDVIKPITEFTLSSIGETSFGISFKDDPRCKDYKLSVFSFGEELAYRLIRPWLHNNFTFSLTKVGRQNAETVKTLHNFSKSVIREKESTFNEEKLSYSTKKRLAMLDLLLKAKYEGANIDEDGIREEVDTFMFEGHDTTSMAICYALLALANEAAIQEEILQEIYEILGETDRSPTYKDLTDMKFMERCIKECLRLYPSVPFIARQTGEEFISRDGYLIPKGTNIHLYIYDLHRNPKIWENPAKFDPDRFLPDNVANRHPFAYIPFSAGSRNCIGQRYAILEIKAALCGILRRFKLEPVHKPEDVRIKVDLVLRPVDDIRVKFVPRYSK